MDKQGPTILELVLQLHGDFRRRLEPICVTPLQAGVLLYLHRCSDARVTEAVDALRVRPPTLSDVVQDLVRKKLAIKRQSAEDGRVFCLRFSRRGQVIIRTIQRQVSHQMESHADTLRRRKNTTGDPSSQTNPARGQENSWGYFGGQGFASRLEEMKARRLAQLWCPVKIGALAGWTFAWVVGVLSPG